MKNPENLKVFCFLRVLECLLSAICFIIHVYGVLHEQEPLSHDFIFCGAFVSFFLISIFAILNNRKHFFSYHLELVSAAIGFVLFMAASMWAMVKVEHDLHLTTMIDFEEFAHFYFRINRAQSVASLVGGFLFLLHAAFAIDYIWHKHADEEEQDTDMIYHGEPKQLQLCFFPGVLLRKFRGKFLKKN